jgi:hypothetical protein
MVSSSPRGRCVGSSSAATAAEDDCIEVDDGVESLLSSAPPPPPRQKIRGQKRAAEALDCLRRCDGGWRRRWLAVAVGGAAMAHRIEVVVIDGEADQGMVVFFQKLPPDE